MGLPTFSDESCPNPSSEAISTTTQNAKGWKLGQIIIPAAVTECAS
jgi:hypothetical protein